MLASILLRIFYILWSVCLIEVCSGLDAPILMGVTATDESENIFIKWKPVNSSLNNPILGYKIFMYEVKQKTARMYKLVHADQKPGLVVEEGTDEVFGTKPLRLARQMLAEGADTENIIIDYIKPNSLHEIRVLSYTRDKESKMSEPWRVKVLKDLNMQGVAHRHVNNCVLTIRNQDIASDIPVLYNNYM